MEKVEINGSVYDIRTVAEYMDDEIREELHNSGDFDDEQSFVDEYIRRHAEKYGEEFVIN